MRFCYSSHFQATQAQRASANSLQKVVMYMKTLTKLNTFSPVKYRLAGMFKKVFAHMQYIPKSYVRICARLFIAPIGSEDFVL